MTGRTNIGPTYVETYTNGSVEKTPFTLSELGLIGTVIKSDTVPSKFSRTESSAGNEVFWGAQLRHAQTDMVVGYYEQVGADGQDGVEIPRLLGQIAAIQFAKQPDVEQEPKISDETALHPDTYRINGGARIKRTR